MFFGICVHPQPEIDLKLKIPSIRVSLPQMPVLYILFFAFLFVPMLPPRWFGALDRYLNPDGTLRPAEKYSIWRAIIHILLSPLLEILAILGLKGAVTLIIFIVIGFDFYFQQQLSNNATILTVVGLISLYFESILEKARAFRIPHIFEFKSKS